MDSTSLPEVVNVLKRWNTEIENQTSDVELSKLFETCLQLQELIEKSSLPSNDKEKQEAISVCIKGMENCTKMVNQLDMFSSNETADDLQTSSIRYLVLPGILGALSLSVQPKNLPDRLENVKIAEVYFKDFMLRCTNYDLCKESLKSFKEGLDKELKNEESSPFDVAAVRAKKIQILKRRKEVESKEKALKLALEKPEMEEANREYCFIFLEKWILSVTEALEIVRREKEILKQLPAPDNKDKKSDVKPLKPFIITKDNLQKQVFGLGYPSIPVMTIDDFYRQRFEKTIEQQKETGKSLQDTALKGEGIKSDAEEIEKEELLEKDDPAALMKARQWDDWKDENPRGSGNRYNKG